MDPTPVERIWGNYDLRDISCGCIHSLILTFDGIVYSCGENGDYEFDPYTMEKSYKP